MEIKNNSKNIKSLSIVYLAILLFIFSFNLVNASNNVDWREYSPLYTYMTNSQDLNSDAMGYFNNGWNPTYKSLDSFGLNTTRTYSQRVPQLTSKIAGLSHFLIFTDGNNLTVYDSSFVKMTSIESGNQIQTLSLFAPNNQSIKILGLFENSSGTFFKSYDYDVVSNILSLNSTSTPIRNVLNYEPSGIKCLYNAGIYMAYNGYVCFGYIAESGNEFNITTYYDNGQYESHSLGTQAESGQTPVTPSILDANNDGKLEALTIDNTKLYFHYLNGTSIFQKNRDTGYFYTDVAFFHDTPSTYKIAMLESYASAGMSDIFLRSYKLNGDGGGLSVDVVTGSYHELKTGQMSILDWNGDGKDEIAVVYSGVYTNIKLYDSVTGFLMKEGSTVDPIFNPTPLSLPSYYHMQGSIISAKLGGDGYPDFIINSNTDGNMSILDIQNNVTVLDYSGRFIPTDIDNDGVLELVGYNKTTITKLDSNYSNQNAVMYSINVTPSVNIGLNAKLTVNLVGLDPEDDILYYYVDCGNGNISAFSQSSTFYCYYNSSGDYNLVGYVRDQLHSNYSSMTIIIHAGANAFTNSSGGQSGLSGYISDVIGLFPPADTLTLGQRIGVTLVVMLATAVIILFGLGMIGGLTNGIDKIILWVILILLIVEFFFFVGISYIPIGFFISVILIALALTYFRLRSGG